MPTGKQRTFLFVAKRRYERLAGGYSWNDNSKVLSSARFRQEALFVLKATGEYRRAGDTVSHPISFEFDQNYPNPFNPSTTFEFALPEACHVTLQVYNILGQEVTTLIDKGYVAGRHLCQWDGSARGTPIASGVYFAKLTAGEYVSTRKMVVVK